MTEQQRHKFEWCIRNGYKVYPDFITEEKGVKDFNGIIVKRNVYKKTEIIALNPKSTNPFTYSTIHTRDFKRRAEEINELVLECYIKIYDKQNN